ncbi:Protein cwh43 [Yamadazyma tenuis]|uniref:Protein cwh43 n=1 Tax=Candida tenuis TaxID=2315449 RepID=UPI00279A60A7|nr:Protein cwh43 [Yamadazyma tenuis]
MGAKKSPSVEVTAPSSTSSPSEGSNSPIRFNAKYIAYAHGIFASSAFFSALIVGSWLHYHKIVKNSSFGYPDEWFPSVSATIGDRYPERSIFQILIAVTSGPRFLLLFCNYLLNKSSSTLIAGVIRTFTCGGWVYITSTDDHDWHDIFMISYILLTIPWTVGVSYYSPKNSSVRKGRSVTAITFFATLIPLVYWFIQHKVHVRPGAYSIYAYFEWSLIILDIGFDTWSVLDFNQLTFTISDSSLSYTIGTSKSKVKLSTEVEPDDDFSFVEFCVHTINSFVVWTNITALFLCVWYFPLWDLGISGYEACIIVIFLAPSFMFIPPAKRFVQRFPLVTRSLGVLFGIGAYKCIKPKDKLMSIAIGTFFSVLSFVGEITALSTLPKKFNTYIIGFVVGLLVSSVLKYMYYTNNPIWPSMNEANGGKNEIGIFVGMAASLLTPGYKREELASTKPITYKGGSILLSAIGIGGLVFSLLAYLTDTSVLVFWNWSGFPITGPTPITGALFNILAISLGVLFSIEAHPYWTGSFFYNLLIGGVSCGVLYFFEDWYGFAGATVFSFYLVSITPIVFQGTLGYNAGSVYTLGLFFCVAFCLASVWIVAYAFVPVGKVLRERTDIVLFGSYVCVLAGVLNYNLRMRASNITKLNYVSKSIFYKAFTVLSVLLALGISVTFQRYPPPPSSIKPYNSGSKSFTAGIWCIHFGLDNDMWSSHDRMRDLIKDAELDIVGLLESDSERLIGGNRDFTQKIAEDLGMYVDYGPGPHKHTWGAALLSKFPIISSKHHLLPSPVGELAPAIEATLDIYGELVDVVVFHSGQEEDVEDRRLQSLGVAEIMANSTRPLVLLSYLVTEPLKGNYFTYASEKSRMHDIDSTDWDRWCEYIMFRDLKKVAYARISRSTITDTELQVAKFRLLSEQEKEEMDEDFLYGNHFIDERKVPNDLKMPSQFKGRGIRGHKYHVFRKPRYFALNKDQVKQQ